MQCSSMIQSARFGVAVALLGLAGAAAAQTKGDLAISWPPGNFHTKNAVAFAEGVDRATGGQVRPSQGGARLSNDRPDRARRRRFSFQ